MKKISIILAMAMGFSACNQVMEQDESCFLSGVLPGTIPIAFKMRSCS